MRQALAEAEEAYRLGEVPIGAVIVQGGQVLARAHNLKETSNDPTAHAEVLALRRAAQAVGNWRLTGCTLYVTVEPCAMCAGAILQARVKNLVYGVIDPKAGAVDSLFNLLTFPGLNHQVHIVAGVLEEECREIMQRFFASLRK